VFFKILLASVLGSFIAADLTACELSNKQPPNLAQSKSKALEDVYMISIKVDNVLAEKKATCIGDKVLFADFGRKKPSNVGLFGAGLSHESPLKKAGWKVAPNIKFFSEDLEISQDLGQFYVTGEESNHISIAWPSNFDELEVTVTSFMLLPNKKNKILFMTDEKVTLLWEESASEGEQKVSIKGLSELGNGELMFMEESGIFVLDEVWVK
jgi:hypothetical protein